MKPLTQHQACIQSLLRDHPHPLPVERILALGQATIPRLGIATVYRTLRRLQDSGWLVQIMTPGGRACFEPAERPVHHHFHCLRCDGLFAVADSGLDLSVGLPRGFRLTGHRLMLIGTCPGCARRSRQRPSRSA